MTDDNPTHATITASAVQRALETSISYRATTGEAQALLDDLSFLGYGVVANSVIDEALTATIGQPRRKPNPLSVVHAALYNTPTPPTNPQDQCRECGADLKIQWAQDELIESLADAISSYERLRQTLSPLNELDTDE